LRSIQRIGNGCGLFCTELKSLYFDG